MSYVIQVPDNARIRPTKPMLRYPGAKNRLARWVISFFPEHETYLEPFAGSAGVFLQKKPCKLEILNDGWKRLTSFLLVVRDRKDELIGKLEQTPFSRVLFEDTREPSDDPLEDAVRFFYHSWCKISNNPVDDGSGMKSAKHANSNYGLPHQNYFAAIDNLHTVQKRLLDAVIENGDALKMMKKHDTRRTLHYVDPPYPRDTRTSGMTYGGEVDWNPDRRRVLVADINRHIADEEKNFTQLCRSIRSSMTKHGKKKADEDVVYSNEWHRRLAETLHSLKGYVVLSGYPCDLYEELYNDKGWAMYTKSEAVNSGSSRSEAIWISPRTQNALMVGSQIEMEF